MINIFIGLTLILKIILLIVLVILLKIYYDSYKKIKIKYTLGLIIFVVLFIFKTVITMPFMMDVTFLPHVMFLSYSSNMLFETAVDLIAMLLLYIITKDYNF